MKDSKIEWTHHTFNPWWGCVRVSPGCEHCYAEAWAKRMGKDVWGVNAPRRMMSDGYWKQPLKWNADAAKRGVRERVFCASMADVFEFRRDLDEPRKRLFELIDKTPHLDWLLLTKRPGNIKVIIDDISHGNGDAWNMRDHLPNVWLGTTVENQQQADKRIPELLAVPASVHFLSCEPLLGSVDIAEHLKQKTRYHVSVSVDGAIAAGGIEGLLLDGKPLSKQASLDILKAEQLLGKRVINPSGCDRFDDIRGCMGHRVAKVDWVICGGESGHGARPMQLDWARALRDQCQKAGTPFLFKQWGQFAPFYHGPGDGEYTMHWKRNKHDAGRVLDGREWNEFPRATVAEAVKP